MKTLKADEIRKLCVVGAGQMGSQIALQAALSGFEVSLNDLSQELLDKAMASNRLQLEKRVSKGKLERVAMDTALGRVQTTTSLEQAAGEADFVIEAIVEVLEDKKELFRKLDVISPPRTVLATNSSYLGNSLLAEVTRRPEKVVNTHFFYPPLVMKLVEVVQGARTSPETVAIAAELIRRMGRVPVVLRKELPGFLVNRILRSIQKEAYYLLESGVASFEDIDRACELGLNHPMGPFKLADFSGLDIGYNARLEVFRESGNPDDRPPESLRRRVERGDLGRKTGRGFYDYSTDPPTPTEG